jgi:hypothetical protein
MSREYKTGGTTSDIALSGAVHGVTQLGQLQEHYYVKKALIEAQKEQYISQLADVTSMPKNMGKKIKRYHYIPLLDDQNINDQGIDANGVTILNTQWYVQFPEFFTVADANATAAVTAINNNVNSATGTAQATASVGASSGGRTTINMLTRTVKYNTQALANAAIAAVPNQGLHLQQGSGNMFGSSKDVGLISGKLPVLGENGGRVNRVGFKRKELEGALDKQLKANPTPIVKTMSGVALTDANGKPLATAPVVKTGAEAAAAGPETFETVAEEMGV